MQPRVITEEIIEKIPVYKLVPKESIVTFPVEICEEQL
jgi:hypothetical protein